MIPGQNLLKMALTLIAKQVVVYYPYSGRTQNAVGQDVTTYGPGNPIAGSFQPVPRRLYQQYGLDLQKDYWTFYTLNDLLDIERNVSGDQIAFQSQRYQVQSANDWFAMDKWKGVLCVRIGVDPASTPLWGFGRLPRTNSYVNFGNGNFIGSEE